MLLRDHGRDLPALTPCLPEQMILLCKVKAVILLTGTSPVQTPSILVSFEWLKGDWLLRYIVLFLCLGISYLSVQIPTALSCQSSLWAVVLTLLLCPAMYSWSHQNIFAPLAQSSSGEQEARLWLTFCVVAMMEVSLFWTSGLLMEI